MSGWTESYDPLIISLHDEFCPANSIHKPGWPGGLCTRIGGIVADRVKAAQDEALAPVLALADEWDVTSRITPAVRALLTDLRAVVEQVKAT